MADTPYRYSISADFPNGKVAPDKLSYEIEQSLISSATFLYINTVGNDCDIWFDDPLSGGDQTTLNVLVGVHDGDEYIYPLNIPEADAPDAVKAEGGQWYDGSDGSMNWLADSFDQRKVDGIWGAEAADAQDLTVSQTTSASWAQKLRLSVTDIPAGRYRIGVSFAWNYSVAFRDFQARVQIDDAGTVYTTVQEPQDAGSDQIYTVSSFAYVNLAAGDHDIDLDFRASQAGDTARIAYARLEFWRAS